MKGRLVMVMALVFSVRTSAQNQQIKVYLQQIAANKAYIELLEKGYQIAKKGLKTIGDIKQGHFRLDGDFFKSLESVNPKVKGYAKVTATLVLLVNAKKQLQYIERSVSADELFSEAERQYVDKVKTNVENACSVQYEKLQDVIIFTSLKMSDDERIGMIDRVFAEAQDIYSFVRVFVADVGTLALQKRKEQRDAEDYRKMADLK